jgi:hypothetical protein
MYTDADNDEALQGMYNTGSLYADDENDPGRVIS